MHDAHVVEDPKTENRSLGQSVQQTEDDIVTQYLPDPHFIQEFTNKVGHVAAACNMTLLFSSATTLRKNSSQIADVIITLPIPRFPSKAYIYFDPSHP
jgi:hypothetical protein